MTYVYAMLEGHGICLQYNTIARRQHVAAQHVAAVPGPDDLNDVDKDYVIYAVWYNYVAGSGCVHVSWLQ